MLNTLRHAKPLLAILLLTPFLPAEAQTMYRCGQVFQDKPCNAGTTSRIIGTSTPQTANPPQGSSTVSDPVCAQRGEQARKIVWAREVGRTRDDQLGNAQTPAERLLVEEVYLMRGRADEIASAIATKCAADRERTMQAAAILTQLRASAGESTPVPAAPTPAVTAEAAATAKAARCTAIDGELRSIQTQERTGGSAGTMERLRNQKRDAEARRQKEAC